MLICQIITFIYITPITYIHITIIYPYTTSSPKEEKPVSPTRFLSVEPPTAVTVLSSATILRPIVSFDSIKSESAKNVNLNSPQSVAPPIADEVVNSLVTALVDDAVDKSVAGLMDDVVSAAPFLAGYLDKVDMEPLVAGVKSTATTVIVNDGKEAIEEAVKSGSVSSAMMDGIGMEALLARMQKDGPSDWLLNLNDDQLLTITSLLDENLNHDGTVDEEEGRRLSGLAVSKDTLPTPRSESVDVELKGTPSSTSSTDLNNDSEKER